MKKQSKLGQFFTTRYEHILQNMNIPTNDQIIIEPFAGECDLMNFLKNKSLYTIEYYDIDPKFDFIIKQDTLKNPPIYKNKYIITNPPYLARNKNKEKSIYDQYNLNDLYKCFIKTIILDPCNGGIIVIPVNFLCSIRKNDILLRKQFLQLYTINHINIFEEQVFEDTAYSVCSLQFELKTNTLLNQNINCSIYPSGNNIQFILNEKNNYTIGGEIYKLNIISDNKISRATKLTEDSSCITNIVLKAIDDNSNNKIQLKIVEDESKYIDNTDNLSCRTYASLVIKPMLSLEKQTELVANFNSKLDEYRLKYNSLFLTNYRESSDIARKRISFDCAFKLCSHLLIE